MSKKNKPKINKTEKTLKTTLNRILNYSALYLPTIENPDLYKIPDPVIEFYRNQFGDNEINSTSIEIVYTNSGELFGYYHIDNDRQITFIIFRSKEDPSKQVFALKNICDNLSNEKDYNIVIRGVLLPNYIFYDNYISEELLEKYKGYRCDVCFYSKFDSYRGSLLIDNKLVHYYEHPFLIKYLDNCESYSHDLFFDFRKYDKIINTNEFTISIYDKYLDIFKTDSFFKDKKPTKNNGKVNSFATDVVTESYYGFNKICFILPSISNEELKLFLNNTFIKIIKELNIDNILFFDRIRFYKSIDAENYNIKTYDDNIHFVENEKKRDSTTFIEYSNEEMINLFLKTS